MQQSQLLKKSMSFSIDGLVQAIMEEPFDPIPGYMECRFCDYGGLRPGKEKEEES